MRRNQTEISRLGERLLGISTPEFQVLDPQDVYIDPGIDNPTVTFQPMPSILNYYPPFSESVVDELRGIRKERREVEEDMFNFTTMRWGVSSPTTIQKSRYSLEDLTPKQQWVLDQLTLENYKELEGMAVKIVAHPDGSPIKPSIPGTIINVHNANPPLKSTFVVEMNDGTVVTQIHQIEPSKRIAVSKIEPKTFKEKILEEQTKIANIIISQVDRAINGQHAILQQQLESDIRNISQAETQIIESRKRMWEVKKQLSTMKKEEIDPSFIIKTLKEIKGHSKVQDAYFSVKGSLIVITKMLVGVDPKTDREDPTKEIGRLAFSISTPITEHIGVINLDFAAFRHIGHESRQWEYPYCHPNIDAGLNICWGENRPDVRKFHRAAQYYQLVDFMITFFSLFPHDSGSPYFDHDEWMTVKERIAETDRGYRDYIRDIIEPSLIEEDSQI